MYKVLFIFFIVLIVISCSEYERRQAQKIINSQRLIELRELHEERQNFLQQKSSLEPIKGTFAGATKTQCFGGKCLTNLDRGSIPKTTYLADYNTMAMDNQPALMSCFPSSFLPYVPSKILKELEIFEISVENISLCWNVQFNGGLGKDAADIGTTRLKSHGWASPDAPPDEHLKGDLVNRNFLLGIYEPDEVLIATSKVKIDQLLSFPVHIHQAGAGRAPISPPGMATIALTHESPSQAFWSLVIDNTPPNDKPKRAGITLHWALKINDAGHSEPQNVAMAFYMLYKNVWKNQPLIFKQVILDLKNNPLFAHHKILNSLSLLLADVWKDI